MILNRFTVVGINLRPIEFRLVKVGDDTFRIWMGNELIDKYETELEARTRFKELRTEYKVL